MRREPGGASGRAASTASRRSPLPRPCGAETLFLGVWERNPRALRFYEKHGFRAVGTQIFRVGSDDQTDIVMARSIVRLG